MREEKAFETSSMNSFCQLTPLDGPMLHVEIYKQKVRVVGPSGRACALALSPSARGNIQIKCWHNKSN